MSEAFPTKVGPSTSRACARCRRQKLKCDVEKPCLLCRRAGLECQEAGELVWKTTRLGNPTARKTARKVFKGRKRKANEVGGVVMKLGIEENTSEEYPDSSTLHLLEETLNLHQSNDLAKTDTSSLPRGEHAIPQDVSHRAKASFRAVAPRAANRRSRTVEELLDVLPKQDGATQLLVDTYFDRVHWFMLVFYQGSFRSRFSDLMILTPDSDSDFSFACVVLTVAALGLQYTCPWRRQVLSDIGVDPEVLLLKLLGTIQSVLFDLVAIGDLESVQACVLVGHFYLFHGCPGTALPIIGCGTRIAQGMGLGRRKMKEWSGAEKRVWMAIFEVDRFCSMVYGLPISFSNETFDIFSLVSCPPSMGPGDYCPKSSSQNPSALLFYKTHMTELSIILTDVLRELYSPSPPDTSQNCNASQEAGCVDSEIQVLSRKINMLDQKLRSWYANVHPILQLTTAESRIKSYETPILMANDIAGNGECFDRHILLMQAITLKLAFENAIIMTHRPLLSFRSAHRLQSENNPCKTSIAACRIAALNTAAIGSWDAFEETLDTYAASFIGIHIFTAGVVLCLRTSFGPQANEAREGLLNLMQIQEKLRSKSVIASQGFEILEKVMGIVSGKERRKKETHEVDGSREGLMQSSASSDLANVENQIDPDRIYFNAAGESVLEGDVNVQLQGPQHQLNFDPVGDYDLEDYQRDPFLGAFASNIEQGWIWDPDWLVNV